MTVKELLQQRRAHQATSGATVSTTLPPPPGPVHSQPCVWEDGEAAHKHSPAQGSLQLLFPASPRLPQAVTKHVGHGVGLRAVGGSSLTVECGSLVGPLQEREAASR